MSESDFLTPAASLERVVGDDNTIETPPSSTAPTRASTPLSDSALPTVNCSDVVNSPGSGVEPESMSAGSALLPPTEIEDGSDAAPPLPGPTKRGRAKKSKTDSADATTAPKKRVRKPKLGEDGQPVAKKPRVRSPPRHAA
jgi:hypothetical protein